MLTIIILSVLLTISLCALVACYFIININLDKIETYEQWVSGFQADVIDIYSRLRKIDEKQIFARDDDVGFAFSEILNIIEKLKDKSK